MRATPQLLPLLALSVLALPGCGGVTNQTGSGVTDTNTATGTAPDVRLGEESYDFGALVVGTAPPAKLMNIANVGGTDLVITSITVDAPFTVNPLSLSLSPGASTQLTIRVQLTTYEDADSDITITSNDEDQGELRIALSAEAIVDADQDGHDLVAGGGDDCDDTNPLVYPGAPEVWYDDVDENCDGLSDYDHDLDGYDAETDQHPVDLADCQDTDPEFHPHAEDVPYDNRDTNCDGLDDWDYDQDGSRSSDYGRGLDCNDNNPDVNSSGTERLNGEDDDCNDLFDDHAEVENSEYTYLADGNYDRVGYAMAIGDLDMDGFAEVIVGSPYAGATNASGAGRGAVSVFKGGSALKADGTHADKANNYIEGDGSSDTLGVAVTVMGDWNDDGTNDLAMCASAISGNSGTVYILDGNDAVSRGDTSDALATYTGGINNYLGRGLGTDIDLDGDGMDDLIAAYASGSSNAIALTYGGDSGSFGIGSVDGVWTTTGTESAFYRNAPVGGDFDGDGLTDLVLSDGSADSFGTDAGEVWVLWGQSSHYGGNNVIQAVATTVAHGGVSGAKAGWATQMGDDWDTDGDDELWMYNASDGLYVVEGGPERRYAFDPTADYAAYYDWVEIATDAEMIRQTGDWSGDGSSDMMVFLEDASSYYGQVMIFSSALRGDLDAKADRIGNGKGTSDYGNGNAGYGMAPKGGDIDGDGLSDFAIGDPEATTNAGEAYVLLNEHTE